MDIKQENIDDLNAQVTIKIEPADYEKSVKSVLDNHRKQMTLQGFRPGKVPFGVAKKMYGKAVLAEELNKLLSENLNSHIKENELNILGQPIPKDQEELQLDFEKTFEFSYELGLAPNFEVSINDKDKFTKYKIIVDDELLNKYVVDFQRRHGQSEEVQFVGDTDMIYGTLFECDKSGTRKEGGVHNHTTIAVEYVDDKASKDKLVGLKVQETLVVEPAKLCKGDADLSAMIGVPVNQLSDLSKHFELRVDSIHKIDPHEINQELFDKVFNPGAVSTEEEFRLKITDDLTKYLEGDSDKKLRRDIQDKLIDKLKLELPDEFLKRWLLESGSQNPEKPITQADIDKEYDDYSRMLRTQLIESEIAKSNEIKVEFTDIEARVKESIKAQFQSFGQPEVDDEMLNQFAQNFLQKEEEVQKTYDQLLDERLTSFYSNTVKIQEKEVSFDEFVKLASSRSGKGNLKDQISSFLKF
ncbi:MAG: trigger factor [Flavobacteriales bacterium]|jgi:trigger factor|nr:trigger factor [Flavobacteriales bacterium]MBT3962901.1 trigger factor [Flavobacteriales bacterium]MBT4705285.1 trigger factor [Flavobacteriales bacterium]MBT4930889.1 trigger factor [Flavobacteriales bacterium]MBT5132773.1 trigger factor [Flavobacteriales bacterium]